MFTLALDEHTELRLLELHYAKELFALINSNKVYLREWLPWLDGIEGEDDVKAFIESTLQQYCNGNGLTACIFYDDKICGIIGYNNLSKKNKNVAIGYWLDYRTRGKGIITKACTRMINHAFDVMKLNRVEIRTAVHNARSRSIPEKLGFTNEGVARQSTWHYDHYVDHVIYGLLAEDWKGHQNIQSVHV